MGYIRDSVDGPGYTAPRPETFSLDQARRQEEEEKRLDRIARRRATHPDRSTSEGDVEFLSMGIRSVRQARNAAVAAQELRELAASEDVEFRGTGGPRIHPGTELPVAADPRTVQPGEVRSVDPRTGAQKGTKLARFDLIPTGPLTELAEHFGRGANKYDDNQWRAGYDWSKSYTALQRHLSAFWSGENLDPDPSMEGASHLAAAAWHCFVLMEFFDTFPEGDDRWKGPVS